MTGQVLVSSAEASTVKNYAKETLQGINIVDSNTGIEDRKVVKIY